MDMSVNKHTKKSNLFARSLRSSVFKQKVVQSKKLYNRKKEKQTILKAAAKKED